MKTKTPILFYLLSIYIVGQFTWWGYLLIKLTKELESVHSNKVTMIMGEGLVFFLLLMFGLWYILQTFKKDLKNANRQNNFLLSVTHELKTPIAANKLFWQTIEKRELNPTQKQDLIQKALFENRRLEALIENILNATRLEHQSMHIHQEKVNLSEFLLQISNRFAKHHPNVEMLTKIEENIDAFIDTFVIETIVSNLIDNALKYASNEGAITIALQQNQKSIVIAVSDFGPGIKDEDKKDIFKKFYRLENEEMRTKSGSGLGLFIVSELAKLHQAKIKVKNNQPKGVIFEIEINKK